MLKKGICSMIGSYLPDHAGEWKSLRVIGYGVNF